MVKRVYSEKQMGFQVEAGKITQDIKNVLRLAVGDVRVFVRYDVEGVSDEDFHYASSRVFSEPAQDKLYADKLPELSNYQLIVIEPKPGQYDQRSDSAAQCLQLLSGEEKPLVECAKVIAVRGMSFGDLQILKAFLINPLENREGTIDMPETLYKTFDSAGRPPVYKGFINFSKAELENFLAEHKLAMSYEDLLHVQNHFKVENRDPFEPEIKVLDTYWSDHCRHTTFLSELDITSITTNNPHLEEAYELYKETAKELYKGRDDKYPCLMDMATIAVKKLKAMGKLTNLDESDEINACSVEVDVDVSGEVQKWLVMFKNETHNHPTEIEPFGGAATCLGGAIRDPLSGRVYVYQAMRVSGGADPTRPIGETMTGKLPQRVISTQSALGYSSYGNQIGLATGLVNEIYHDGYKAKHMDCGYVIGAAPKANVVREVPEFDDVIILLGGETGRDGCGGATGSSKSHTIDSVAECSSEVQKGNPVVERKIQRLFRNPEVSQMIIKCNDFGAGGVSVAIGELADGVDIHLDKVPRKYHGLTATEVAISESQERMAVIVKPWNVDAFIAFANEENLDATPVATVTDTNRMRMFVNYKMCVDLCRNFLNTNGAKQFAKAEIFDNMTDYMERPSVYAKAHVDNEDWKSALLQEIQRLNVGSQKGMAEQFDSTIGAGSVLMPFGGKYQLTAQEAMVAKIPVMGAETDTVTVSTYGFNPNLMSASPFTGSVYSIISSVAKQISAGADYDTIYLSLQEYFKRLGSDPKRWGEPTSAMLGAFLAQMKLGMGAIGGKDSMSGSYENIDVPPTLISFAMGIGKASTTISNTFTRAEAKIYRVRMPRDEYGMPDWRRVPEYFKTITKQINSGAIVSAQVIGEGGAIVAGVKSCLGNGLGFKFTHIEEDHFLPAIGDMLLEVAAEKSIVGLSAQFFGKTTAEPQIELGYNNVIKLDDITDAYTWKLRGIYPLTAPAIGEVENLSTPRDEGVLPRASFLCGTAKPRVFMPVFPGTNCEYDTARAFEKAGAEVDLFVFKNRTGEEIRQSIEEMAARLSWSQILMLPGGFSGGDEPAGSGKFIVSALSSEQMQDAIHEFLNYRDGLALGICNGFQALIKLGLVPYGEIRGAQEGSPTLTHNNIGRHVSQIVRTRVASNRSPWLQAVQVGDIFSVPVSHGEGKFICSPEEMQALIESGQIATQYVDLAGNATMESPFNPNGSAMAVEGILSPDGRVFGKMGHAERVGKNLYKNVPGEYDMKIFQSGVRYFRG